MQLNLFVPGRELWAATVAIIELTLRISIAPVLANDATDGVISGETPWRDCWAVLKGTNLFGTSLFLKAFILGRHMWHIPTYIFPNNNHACH